MLVLTVIFGKLAKFPSEGAPYPILVFAAMLPWQFFANSLTECSNSLIGNAGLISKIYFPRLVIPTSSVIVSFVDFLLSGTILLGLMAWYNFWPTWRVLALPFLILISFGAAMGTGLWISAMNVKYRDFRYISPHNFSDNYFQKIFLPVLAEGIENFFYRLHNDLQLSDQNITVFPESEQSMEKKFTGEDGEVGAVSYWNGNKEVGEGEQEIKKIIEGERIESELRFLKPFKSTSDCYIDLAELANGTTQVKWGFSGRNKFPMTIMSLFKNMDSMVGPDFEEGMASLKTVMEKK